MGRNMHVASHLEAVHAARRHERDKAQQVLGHQHEDIERHHRIGQADKQEYLRNTEVGFEQGTRQHGAGDHEQGVQNIVGRNDAGTVRGLAAQLDQGVHGHAVQAGEQAQQGQVSHDAPVGRLAHKRAHAHDAARRQAARGKVQVDGKHAHANRAQRHQANFNVAFAQHLAQQRAGSNAYRKNHQQQRRYLLVAVDHFFGKARELT